MNAYRPLALISLAFGVGAYVAILVHTHFTYWGLGVYVALIAAICLFALGSLLLGSRRKVFVRGSGVIALFYGAATYVIAFIVAGVAYHSVEAPPPTISVITMLIVAFLSGALFVSMFGRTPYAAS